ncbi:hypothetical protein GcM3_057020 [Golovinomyces cichoracearum]|uniref:Uncharacterized protein n=1 Tax=Golovinomyces cichoracearum TaxID=62708 RepID=A0A420IXI0_9PEZI|nr:hypothetical protein GcM3_057020 [Golovinomyces cichoracearum]
MESYQIKEEEHTMQHTFFGEFDGKDLLYNMTDLSVHHMISSGGVTQNDGPAETLTSSISRYDDRHYHGIMIDNGAACN